MKKKIISLLISGIMTFSLLTPINNVKAAESLNTEDSKSDHMYISEEESNDVLEEERRALERYRSAGNSSEYQKMIVSATENKYNYPTSVDNSKEKYFPPIVTQVGGSCVFYANTYYLFTYQYNKANNTAANCDENIMSPKFTFNFNSSYENYAKSKDFRGTDYIGRFFGIPSIAEVPIGDGVATSDNYFSDLHAEENIWKDAIKHRVKDTYSFSIEDDENPDTPIESYNDSSLNGIKYVLAEGNIVTFGTDIDSFNYYRIEDNSSFTGNKKYAGQYIVPYCAKADTVGGHQMTIVGYDDDIWYDINGDGVAQDAEKGALKIANSWGDDYRNDGFVWVSYDAINKISAVEQTPNSTKSNYCQSNRTIFTSMFTGMVAEKENNGGLYLQVTLNTNKLDKVTMKITANDGSLNDFYCDPCGSGANSNFQGNDGYGDGTLIYDLKNIYTDANYKDILGRGFKISFYKNDTYSDVALKVKDLKIIDKDNNKVYDSFIKSDILVNGNLDIATNESNIQAPGNLKVSSDNNKVSLSWDKSTSSNGTVMGYSIFRDGVLIGETQDTFFEDNINLDKNATYEVKAFDSNNLYSLGATKEVEKNVSSQLKVYYKNSSFSKGYIHYKIGNGNWTAVPGVEMTKSTDKPGYFEYSIDLSAYDENTEVTACFNNGNGTWDSRNGNNYILKKGTNTVENGTATNTSSTNEFQIKNIFYGNDEYIPMGTVAKISADIIGGSSNYDTQYKIEKTGEDSEILTCDSNNSAIWTPKSEGNYKITCTVKDNSNNKTISKSININVKNDFEITDIKFNKSFPLKTKSILQGNVEVNRNQGFNIKISGKLLKDGEEYQTIYENYSSDKYGTFSIYSLPVGNYTIDITATDKITGCTAEKEYSFKVIDSDIEINDFYIYDGNNTNVPITTGEVYGNYYCHLDVSGGTNNTNYKYGYYHNGEYTLISDFKSYSYCQFAPTEPGQYTIECIVESNGVTVKKTYNMNIEKKDFEIVSINSDKEYIYVGNGSYIKAKVNYGKSPYTYDVSCKKDGVVTNSYSGQSNSNSIESYITFEEVGEYEITFNVQDNLGNKCTKTKTITILPKEDVTGISFSKASPQIVGEEIKIQLSTISSDCKCKITTYGGNTMIGRQYTDLEMVNNNTAIWTPKVDGKYIFTVEYTDKNGNSNIKTLGEYIVEHKPVEKNITTIYYNGYNNPYIHYKIGDEGWTLAPGIKMTPCTDVEGFNYKAEIDLGDATTLTACFNDGKGNWTSNNGNNYIFGVGYYTFNNGVITKIEKPIKKLTISEFTVNPSSETTVSRFVTLSGEVKNNDGEVTYTYEAKDSTGNVTKIAENTTESSVKWQPQKAGKYTLMITATDAKGNIATSEKEFTVNDTITLNNVTFNKTSPIYVGQELSATVSFNGGTGKKKCLSIKAQGGNYQFGSREVYFTMNSDNSGTWKPDTDGTYSIMATVQDEAGYITMVSLGTYEVKNKELEITSITSSAGTTIKNGEPTEVTINAEGGKGSYTYELYYSLYGSGRTYYILNGTSTNKGTFTPNYPQEWILYAKVTDEAGNTASKQIKITSNDVTSNITTIYYKGYDNPYIHYQIGNGSWTAVPGIKMTACTDVSGYYYKAEIDLGDATTLTACFNDGNGSWDSRNGQNYNFGVGSYTYSNGVITKINN
ncbi:MAG: hypothetical protein GX275_03600 [Clostridiales bacterium]|nr:hypothetical protein [Clostridiales bacterium]